jgi:tetratricopeptide (TPR) repeat protein
MAQSSPAPGSPRPNATNRPLGTDLPELQEARRLWQLNHFAAALERFAQAVRRCPQNLTALLDAARAFGTRHEIRQAEEWLARAVELGGRDPRVLHLVAQTYRMIFRPAEAMRLFERVIAQTTAIPDAFLELALLYERRHRLDEALALIERCLRTFPAYLEPRLIEARIKQRQKLSTEAATILRSLADNAKAHPQLQAQAWADLAELLDRQGDYEGAFAAISRGKDIQRRDAAAVRRISELQLAQLQPLHSQVSTADFIRWRSHLSDGDEQRVALLTGFPRSGTTLLEQVLDAHPDLVSSEELEVFSRDIFPEMWATSPNARPTVAQFDALPHDRWLQLRDRYLRAMEEVRGEPLNGRMHLDKAPTLTQLTPAFLRLFPEGRILLALRDPRDVVLSCFLRYLPLNPNSVWFLTLADTADRYARDLRTWLTLRDQLVGGWLQVRYEDLVDDLPGQARRCLNLLGLPWDDAVLGYRERLKDKAVSSPTYASVVQPVYRTAIGRWRNYERHFVPALKALEPFVREFGYG